MSAFGCLVLHGFAGDVHEVLPLAMALQKQGYTVECPTLEGHGAGRLLLSQSRRSDWIDSAVEAYKRLSLRCDKIAVIGFSMGGLLALQIASRHPVHHLFTLNTPFYYWDIKQAAVNLRNDFRTHLSRYMNGMAKFPIRSMLEFRMLLAETKRLLPRVTCPYVIVQGEKDDTVQAVSACHLQKHVGSADTRLLSFPESGHLILHGPEAEDVIRHVSEILKERMK
ncbi:alpha/beta hydrolase [Brevibacillus sp. B_LB10_24]|uniref:alpha/beta hydrolase n=1 Tax=Brevibacillus sp. B_LB10_24 TaxID=3380645 RepID=UPI0038BA1B01